MTDMAKDRQDIPIWNAIEANNFKQALRLAEKRLAKKHTEYLEALVVYIRSRLPQSSEKSTVLAHLESLPTRKQTLLDLDAIELYDEALREVLPNSKEKWSEIIGELRWLCVKASPKSEELAVKCFRECLLRDDLEHARLIANSLDKNLPGSHAYIFWSITTMFLYSLSTVYPEKQRKIWAGLALGQINKLAAASRQTEDPQKLPVKSIHSPQELLLLHKILKNSGKQERGLEYLRDPLLGPDSAIAKGDWQLWRLRIQLAKAAQEWQDVFETAGALLRRARTKDQSGQLSESRMCDWLVWEAYIRSALELSDHKYTDAVTAELEAHLDPASGSDKSWRRNAALAWVKFSFEKEVPFSRSDGRETTIENGLQVLSIGNGGNPIIVKYLQQYGDASTAYNDLRPFVERLNTEEQQNLVAILWKNHLYSSKVQDDGKKQTGVDSTTLGHNLTTATQITQAVNSYKLIYLLTISQPEMERSLSPLNKSQPDFICKCCCTACKVACSTCLERFVVETMEAYKSAVNDDDSITSNLLSTDRHPADDLCILAAMALIKLCWVGESSSAEPLKRAQVRHLLRATILLEYAWTRSKSNFQISLMLVKLYSYLGCGSLAMRAFHRLTLKQIQLDTLSYVLFDRISSTHPHPFSHIPDGTTQFRSPAEHFRKQQKLYANAGEQVSKNMALAFNNGSYNAICEFREFFETLQHSMSAAMHVVESRRVSRVISSESASESLLSSYDILPPNPEVLQHEFADTNDYDSTPNFESSKAPRFEQRLRFLPGSSDFRTRSNLKMEKLLQILQPKSGPEPKEKLYQEWLRLHLNMAINQEVNAFQGSRRSESHDERLSSSEHFAMLAFDDMAHIMQLSLCADFWSNPNFQGDLTSFNTSLLQRLERQLAVMESLQDIVPALAPTLHEFYISYDVGRTVLMFNKYLSQPKICVHKPQLEANKKLVEGADRLVKVVVSKCAIVKKGLDEGGWIDRVLDSLLDADVEQSNSADEVSSQVVATLRGLTDENFLEEWAGLVVESWGDSIVGLSYLKGNVNL